MRQNTANKEVFSLMCSSCLAHASMLLELDAIVSSCHCAVKHFVALTLCRADGVPALTCNNMFRLHLNLVVAHTHDNVSFLHTIINAIRLMIHAFSELFCTSTV